MVDTIPLLAWSARSDGSADFFTQRRSQQLPAASLLTSSPPLKKGEDSYGAWFGFNLGTFGGFLFSSIGLTAPHLRRLQDRACPALGLRHKNDPPKPMPRIHVLNNGALGRIW